MAAGERTLAETAVQSLGLMARIAGWSPDVFWAATPADVHAVLAAWLPDNEAVGIDRAVLAAMMEQYPDG